MIILVLYGNAASAPFVNEESGDEDEEFSTAHETGEGVETEQPGAEYNLYEGTGCLGETLVFKSGVPSVAACQAWCEKRHWQGCAAFVYAPDRNRCYLKTNCDRREVESDNISGVKLAIGSAHNNRLSSLPTSLSCYKP
jgi:hypothetical protein